jgi:hypothetical protein
MPGCEAPAFEGAFADSSFLIRLGGSFEGSNARLDIFQFDSLERAIKDTLSRPKFDGRRNIRIGHQLQDDCGSGARGLATD